MLKAQKNNQIDIKSYVCLCTKLEAKFVSKMDNGNLMYVNMNTNQENNSQYYLAMKASGFFLTPQLIH
jgi:hypothetical protein